MTLAELQSLIGTLCNDAAHDRYSLADITTELDNTQNSWNIEAKIIKETTTLTVIDSQRQYLLSLITGTPVAFPRVTHKGLEIDKRSKTWFDLYSGVDWTTVIGTPTAFFIEAQDPTKLYITLYPTPQSGDAGANLVVEAIIAHTPMSLSTDVPFMLGTSSNYLLRPYDYGVAYETSARLLTRDPTSVNAKKQVDFNNIAGSVKANVIQVFRALEAEEPKRFRGGRYWDHGTVTTAF